jgi:hypothetical protein
MLLPDLKGGLTMGDVVADLTTLSKSKALYATLREVTAMGDDYHSSKPH